jgi:hypothetical protein
LQRLAHVDQSDRDTWTNQIVSRRSRPASASPHSRPPLARAGAPAQTKARRYRPLSPDASAIARRRPLARLSLTRGRQRPLLACAAARTATSLTTTTKHVGLTIKAPAYGDMPFLLALFFLSAFLYFLLLYFSFFAAADRNGNTPRCVPAITAYIRRAASYR